MVMLNPMFARQPNTPAELPVCLAILWPQAPKLPECSLEALIDTAARYDGTSA